MPDLALRPNVYQGQRLVGDRYHTLRVGATRDHPGEGGGELLRGDLLPDVAFEPFGSRFEILRLETRLSQLDLGRSGELEMVGDLVHQGEFEVGSRGRDPQHDRGGVRVDDRFTAHDPEAIEALGLNGGKMLLRILDDDPGTVETLESSARAVTELSRRGLISMVEPLPAFRDEIGRLRISTDIDDITGAVAVASGLGASSTHTWLKLPAADDPERVMAATTLPALLLGGDPGPDRSVMLASWRKAMSIPNVRGLVAGRSLLFPPDGDVERATDLAVEIVHGAGS